MKENRRRLELQDELTQTPLMIKFSRYAKATLSLSTCHPILLHRLFSALTSVSGWDPPLCSSHKKALQSWGCASKHWPSANFSRSQPLLCHRPPTSAPPPRTKQDVATAVQNSAGTSAQSPNCRMYSRCILPDSDKRPGGQEHPCPWDLHILVTLAITLSCRPCSTPWA